MPDTERSGKSSQWAHSKWLRSRLTILRSKLPRLYTRDPQIGYSGAFLKWIIGVVGAFVITGLLGLAIAFALRNPEANAEFLVSGFEVSEGNVESQSDCAAVLRTEANVSDVYANPFVGRIAIDYTTGSGSQARIYGGSIRVVHYEPPPRAASCDSEIGLTSSNIGNAGEPGLESAPRFTLTSKHFIAVVMPNQSGADGWEVPTYERSTTVEDPGFLGSPKGPLAGTLSDIPLAVGGRVYIDFVLSALRTGTYTVVPVLRVQSVGTDTLIEGTEFTVSVSTAETR